MGTVDNGLTLEGLAQRLEALERENASLRDAVSAFRDSDTRDMGHDRVVGVSSTPSASRTGNEADDEDDQVPEVSEVRMSRRRWLKGAAAAAAGLVVAGSLSQRDIREAKAADRFQQLRVFADISNQGAIEGINNSVSPIDGQSPTGIGVRGQGNLIGVRGESTRGYGGYFTGAKAQLKLLPHAGVGPPNGGHQKGELFLDEDANLFVCKASGTPGAWKKFNLVNP